MELVTAQPIIDIANLQKHNIFHAEIINLIRFSTL